MTTGADTQLTKSKPCLCCGHDKVNDECICLWCRKDNRKYALYSLCPHLCDYYKSDEYPLGVRFCRCCLGLILHSSDITGWLVFGWDKTEKVKPSWDEVEEYVAVNYEREYESLYENLCDCEQWSEGYNEDERYVKDTLGLSDVQVIESMRAKVEENNLIRDLDDDL